MNYLIVVVVVIIIVIVIGAIIFGAQNSDNGNNVNSKPSQCPSNKAIVEVIDTGDKAVACERKTRDGFKLSFKMCTTETYNAEYVVRGLKGTSGKKRLKGDVIAASDKEKFPPLKAFLNRDCNSNDYNMKIIDLHGNLARFDSGCIAFQITFVGRDNSSCSGSRRSSTSSCSSDVSSCRSSKRSSCSSGRKSSSDRSDDRHSSSGRSDDKHSSSGRSDNRHSSSGRSDDRHSSSCRSDDRHSSSNSCNSKGSKSDHGRSSSSSCTSLSSGGKCSDCGKHFPPSDCGSSSSSGGCGSTSSSSCGKLTSDCSDPYNQSTSCDSDSDWKFYA